eukprot:GILI01007187.1.p1 GENE.GILI01007187.1~~GILI01007187.1.p1  ORF type:complete len:529 (+),score=121.34 GILI01007187.1:49-1635(+)
MDFDLSEIALAVERIAESETLGTNNAPLFDKMDPAPLFATKTVPATSSTGSNNGSINAATPSVGPTAPSRHFHDDNSCASDGDGANSPSSHAKSTFDNWKLNPQSTDAGILAASQSRSGHQTPNSIPAQPHHAIAAPQYQDPSHIASQSATAGPDAFHEAAALKGVKSVPLRTNRRPLRNYESTAGVFVGQLPVLYSPYDVVQLLCAVGAESGVDVQVKDVKMHPRNTCAFVDVNAECIPALVKYNRMVLCDVHTLWVATDPARVTDLLAVAERCCNRNFSGVPRTTVVLEQSTRDPYTGRRQRPTKFNPTEPPMFGSPQLQSRQAPIPYHQHQMMAANSQLRPYPTNNAVGAPFHPAATSNSFLPQGHKQQTAMVAPTPQPTLVLDVNTNQYMYVMVDGAQQEASKAGSFTVQAETLAPSAFNHAPSFRPSGMNLGNPYATQSQFIPAPQWQQPPPPQRLPAQQPQPQVPHCSSCRVPYVAGLVAAPTQCALCYTVVSQNTIAHRCDVCKTHICLKCMGTVVSSHQN